MQTEVLSGRYELLDRLGRGGMSVVWRARDLVLERDVAVKMLAGAAGLATVSMRAEAMAAAKVVHPHVASVFDFGEVELESDGPTAFIVMELLEGTRLCDVTMPMPPVRALRIGAEVAAALAAAHAQGVVHRDVKPGNVMLTRGGVKMFDFGIAASVGTADLDSSTVILGSPRYVAPERLLGEPVTAASDVYALGVMLYCLLTGGFPWPAGTVSEMVMSHVAAQPADLPDISGVPDDVRAAYRRAVARDPADRPPATDLAAVLAEAAGIAVPLGHGPTGLAVSPRPAPARPLRFALIGVVAVAIAGLVALAAWALAGPPRSSAAAPVASAVASGPTTTAAGSDPAPSTNAPATGSAPEPGSAPAGAGSGTGQVPPAPGPSTTPTPTPTPGPEQTFTATGGQVVAVCQDELAQLLSWTPTIPYRVGPVVAGPTTDASASFRHGNRASTVTVSCAAGVPVATVSDT